MQSRDWDGEHRHPEPACSTSGHVLHSGACPQAWGHALPLPYGDSGPCRAAWEPGVTSPCLSFSPLQRCCVCWAGKCLSLAGTKRYHLLFVQLLVRRGCQ